jgi:hypothetical protein
VRMQGRSYRLRNAAMMAGARRKADKPENPTEPEPEDIGTSTGGPLMGPESHAAGRYRPIALLRPATALPPIGDPALPPKNTKR